MFGFLAVVYYSKLVLNAVMDFADINNITPIHVLVYFRSYLVENSTFH